MTLKKNKINNQPYYLISIFLLFIIAIIVTGYFFYRSQRKLNKEQHSKYLQYVLETKINQITTWREELLRNTKNDLLNPFIQKQLKHFLFGSKNNRLKLTIYSWMKSVEVSDDNYKNILLLDKKRNLKITLDQVDSTPGNIAIEYIERAITDKKITMTNIHRKDSIGFIHFDLIVPINDFYKGDTKVIGTFIVRINPFINFYKMIQSWPSLSKTAEVLIVSKSGDKVVFLNELRHKKNTTLNLNLPVNDIQLPAAMAARGMEGIIEGIDYRGEKVLAAIKAIPNSPWFIVTKIDLKEIHESMEKILKLVLIIIMTLIIATGSILGLLWHKQRSKYFRSIYEKEMEQKEYRMESEKRYHNLFENSPIPIWEADLSELIEYFNEIKAKGIMDFNIFFENNPESLSLCVKTIKILDINKMGIIFFKSGNKTELLQNLYNYFSPATLRTFKEVMVALADGVQNFEGEVSLKNLTGQERTVIFRLSFTPNYENDPSRVLITFFDITERKLNEIALNQSNYRLEESLSELKETQKQVLQQERLRALGQMASGIAHDINNSLAPILGYSDLLLEEEVIFNLAQKPLTVIKTSSLDIKRTIERLREFYKPKFEDSEFSFVSLNKIIKSTIDLTRHRWKDIPEAYGAVIEITTQLQTDLPLIKGNESDLREALTNLIINAADAMQKGGLIKIRSYSDEKNIIVEIKDNGIGMDEVTKKHCLDPFYTTKGEKGSGLGLSMVFGIIQRHKGNIEIDSEISRGTKIKLLFSFSELFKSNTIIKTDLFSIPQLKILCIDDDKNILEILETTLTKKNHSVEIVTCGKEGLESFDKAAAENKPYNLVITDLGMPYLDGISVAQNIKFKSPDTPIILLTGWGAFLEKDNIKCVDYILKKPFTILDLDVALHAVLK